MTHRIGPNGRAVIPKALRDALGLQPGTEVELERDGDAVRIARPLRGSYPGSDLAAELLADRAREPR